MHPYRKVQLLVQQQSKCDLCQHINDICVQISAALVLHFCGRLVKPWSPKAAPLLCSTLCRGSAMKSYRLQTALTHLSWVCLIFFTFLYSRFDPQIYKLISAALWPISSAESSQRRGVSCERHSTCDSSLRHSSGISFLQRDVFDLFLLSFQQGFVIFQTDSSVIMENGILRTVVSKDGTLASLHLIAANR